MTPWLLGPAPVPGESLQQGAQLPCQGDSGDEPSRTTQSHQHCGQ